MAAPGPTPPDPFWERITTTATDTRALVDAYLTDPASVPPRPITHDRCLAETTAGDPCRNYPVRDLPDARTCRRHLPDLVRALRAT